ncbi:putative neural-cadherin 2 [Ylistrum balloti]|uniref:putative neural-cadherin 2 n=1 Tax=Ylistrum balloti TaxID=509963 RepID=UPI002905B2E6|nr:putative neural-cadherin 2 [Ylistrum balloti]
MATAIQVTLCLIINVCISVSLGRSTGVSAVLVEMEIPSNAPKGFKVTKLGCNGRDFFLNVPENEIQLFTVSGSGDLVLKESVKGYENRQLTVHVTRLAITDCPQCTDIPEISRLTVTVKPPSHFIRFPNEIRGHADVTGSSQVLGEDMNALFKASHALYSLYTLIGSEKSVGLFEFQKDTNGNLQLHLADVPSCRVYYLLCKVVSSDHQVLFTNLRIDIRNGQNTTTTVKSDVSGAREPSVYINTDQKHDLRRQGHDLTVNFRQDKKQTIFHHRYRRQVKTAAVTKTIDEGSTGVLYQFTRQGTGTFFDLKQAVPDVVTVDQNGQVEPKPGSVLDADNGTTSILVEVYERTGNSEPAEYEHTLTLVLNNINDEVPRFTNIPRPMLATVDAWASNWTTCYTLTALDPDPGSLVGFYMKGTSSKFEVVELTGEIKTKAPLLQNYDEEITVFCKDKNAPTEQISSEEKVFITTKYRAPQFYLPEYKASVPENAQSGQIFSLQNSDFNDVDLQSVNFQNGMTVYSVINPRTRGHSSLFDIKDGKLLTLGTYDHEKMSEYPLLLQAKDSTSELTSSVSLMVRITDVNEFDPVFDVSPDFAEVSESLRVGETAMQVTVTDKDTSSTINYLLNDEYFDVESVNNIGNIRVKKALDYETAPDHMHSFTVFAVDDGGVLNMKRTSSASVIIKLDNVNDLEPVFVDSSISMKVLDNADAPGADVDQKLVLDMTAYDADGDVVTYSLGGGSHEIFEINADTGIIRLKSGANIIPDDVSEYNFDVLAVDDNSCCSDKTVPLHTSTASVTVYIVDAVNRKPRFTCNYKPSVLEEQPVGTDVVTVEAVDTSRGEKSEVEYSLRRDRNFDSSKYFSIDKKTGKITTTARLDRELFSDIMFITVQATDRGDPPLSDLCTFVVNLADTNDHSPVFTSTTYSQTLYRDSPIGTVGIVVLAEDDDSGVNADVKYSFIQNPGNYFNINNNGVIKTAANLGNAPPSIVLEVMATDSGSSPRSSSTTITMTLQSDYRPPSTSQAEYTFGMSEVDDIGTVVGNIVVSSNADQAAVSLQIVNNVDGLIIIREVDPTTNIGQFELVIAKERIRYEKYPEMKLVLRASNEQPEPQNTYIFAKIENEDKNMLNPEYIGEPFISADNYNIKLDVLEGLDPQEPVGFVVAIDGDTFTPAYSNVTYYEQSSSAFFSIDSVSGEIRTKKVFDAEEEQIYYFSLIAKDGAPSATPNHQPPGTSNSATATVQIQISDANDNTPTFDLQQYAFTVPEDAALESSVGELKATDLDSGHVFRFTLDCNIPTGAVIPFSANWTTGVIYVSGYLDFESTASYSCTAKVFDGKFIAQTNVDITVLDVNDMPPVFSQSTYNFDNVNEGDYSSNPYLFGRVLAADGDTGRVTQTNIRYSILTDPGDTSISSKFELDATTGNLTVKGELDRDTQPVVTFIVSAIDEPSSSNPRTGYATVKINLQDMNDNDPIFVEGTLVGSVVEEQPVGTTVMRVIADDIDEGPNGEVSYSLVPVTNPFFRIPIRSSGVIQTNVVIDREQNDQFTVLVSAQDGGTGGTARSTTGTATIYVIDINDNNPHCNDSLQSVTIKETLEGKFIAVHAYDADTLDILSYRVSDSDFAHFAIQQENSVANVIVHDSPDFDIGETFFNISVTVTDGTNSAICYVEVTVEDVNDNAPVFSDIHVRQGGNISEDISVNTEIANFTATDIDSGDNQAFEFFILLDTDINKYFAIENLPQGQGKIKVQRALDRETVPEFDLTVLAIDSGSPPQTGSTVIRIILEDVNDNGPILKKTQISIKENIPPQPNFETLYAQDPDSPENGPPFSFNQVVCDSNSPSVCGKFEFNIQAAVPSEGGQALSCSSLTSLDREEASFYLVDVVIQDKDGMSATSTLTILIEDENDNKNTDAQQSLFAYNYNGILKNVVIGRVGFNDLDGDEDRATKTFSKVSDYTDFYVRVELNGDIVILSNVPYGTFDFKVTVEDTNVKINGVVTTVVSTTTVTVTLEELDAEAPYKAGSIRLSGITAKEFISTPPGNDGKSHYRLFREKMAEKLGKPVDNVQIVTMLDKVDLLEIRFAAHGSPYYTSARLNGIVTDNKNEFETASGGKIETVGVSECLQESCEGGCWDKLVVEESPNVVNAGTDTKVGVVSGVVPQCGCRVPVSQTECTPDYCFNDGQCVKDDYGILTCVCTASFDGPRCQNTKKGFSGSGYALFKPLEQCLRWETSIEFITQNANGLILYNGPLTALSYTDPTDYIVLQLRNGYPELTVDLGTGALTLYLDGTGASTLSDGKWHHINIIKDGKMITLTVDHCRTASGTDRSSCEMTGYTKSTHMYLNINTPLQMGGTSPSTLQTPQGVTAAKFSGCMRNLRHKGELYDLHTGGVYDGTTDSCPEEDEACGNKCGDHGECRVTDISVTPKTTECICDGGYRGDNCGTVTTTVDFGANSFMEWSLVESFANQLSVKETELQMMYRSRDQEGILFHLTSSEADKFIRLQIINNELMLVYNLGGDQGSLAMPGVEASNGRWHTVNIKRVSRTFVMAVDGGEGLNYVTSSGPLNSQGEITLLQRQIYAGAELLYDDNLDTTGTFDGKDFNSSCYNDIRLETAWFPMTTAESSENTLVNLDRRISVQNNCVRNDCVGVSCPATFVCKGLWEAYKCICPSGKVEVGNTCVDINYCLDSPCMGSATCRNGNGTFICDCPEGWKGKRCNLQAIVEVVPAGGTNVGLIVGIIVAVVLVLIIAFVLFLLYKRCAGNDDMANLVEDEKEDYDIRENIVAYDEEGAGEEDHEGYDLNRLRKPMDMSRADKPLMNMENERPVKSGPPQGPGIGEFIGDRLGDADDDPGAPPYDTLMELNYEGGGSSAGSLSSLNTSSSGGDQDYDYLNNWGPKFAKLADMYNQYEDSD